MYKTKLSPSIMKTFYSREAFVLKILDIMTDKFFCVTHNETDLEEA